MASNSNILSLLDSFKSYASDYEERKKQQQEEGDKSLADGGASELVKQEMAKKKTIQEEIAETLKKIKEQEAETAKRIEIERKQKEEKKKKEQELKAKIQEELEKIHKLEEIQKEQIRVEQEKRDREWREKKAKEEAERKKQEELEAKQRAEKAQEEAKKRKQLLQEIEEMKLKKAQEEAQKLVEEAERQMALRVKEKLEKEKRQKEEERKRQLAIEEEKKRLWEEEREKERKQVEEVRKARIEEDRRIAAEILERKKREEENLKEQKRLAEENRMKEINERKKQTLEDKKKSLMDKFSEPAKAEVIKEKPMKKQISNPFAQKFEELSKLAQKDETNMQELFKKKKKLIKKSQDLLKRSRQYLNKLSRENLKRSQTMKPEQLKSQRSSREKLRRSASKEKLKGSRHDIDKGKHSPSVSKKQMQNYLLSQVLFDGKEEVKSSKVRLNDIKEKEEEEEDAKLQQMIEKEQELIRQIEEELRNIKKAEDEQRMKNEEEKFENYKKEMEKYLDFVCESDSKQVKKKKAPKSKKDATTTKKLTVNISSIKNQFEDGTVQESQTPGVKSAPVTIRKIDPSKLFCNKAEEEAAPKKKKVVEPVIIDKDAFQRTMEMFEKEKREEEERREREERNRKRRQEMEEERQRLKQEKERIIKEEEERIKLKEQLQREKEMLEEAKRKEKQKLVAQEKEKLEAAGKDSKIDESANENKEGTGVKDKKPDIHEIIRLELEKIRIEEEKQREKIQKENKKRELMKQIQNELNKINNLHTEQGKINSTQAKSKEKSEKQQSKVKETDIDVEPPKWLKIFMDKSKQIEEMKSRSSCTQGPEQSASKLLEKSKTESNIISKSPMVKKKKECKDQSMESKTTEIKLDVLTSFIENEPKETFADKIKKIKSFFTEEEKPSSKPLDLAVAKDTAAKMKQVFENMPELSSQDAATLEKIEKVIKKGKTSNMKKMLESKLANDQKAEEKVVKRPKKKIVKVNEPISETFRKPRPETTEWKWKSKSSVELYNYLSENKLFMPQALLDKVNESIENSAGRDESSQTNEEMLEEEKQFDDYIDSIQNFIAKESKSETESIFKDTLTAYLDLIDDRPSVSKKAGAEGSKALPKISFNTAMIKDQFENYQSKEEAGEAASDFSSIGKVDTSFLANESKPTEKSVVDVPKTFCKSLKEKYETKEDVTQERTFSMPKGTNESGLISMISGKYERLTSDVNEESKHIPRLSGHDWKYKRRTMSELYEFVNKNKDLMPQAIVDKSNNAGELKLDLAKRTKAVLASLEGKEKDFDNFLQELDDYSNKPSESIEEDNFKQGVKLYLDLIDEDVDIDPASKSDLPNLPSIGSVFKLDSIKSKLKKDKAEHKTKPTSVGKVSYNLKKSREKDSGQSNKEALANLLKPGKTAEIKSSFESSKGLMRSASEMNVGDGKAKPNKLNIANLFKKEPQSDEKEFYFLKRKSKKYELKPKPVDDHRFRENRNTEPVKKETLPQRRQVEEMVYQDPEERKNAILAKYGFKPARKVEDIDDDSDIDEYLNYENSREIEDYKEKLRDQYNLNDRSSSSRSPSPEKNKGGSFSSLLNILKTMRKSNLSKTVKDSRSRLDDLSQAQANPGRSMSAVDLSFLTNSTESAKSQLFSQTSSGGRRTSQVELDELKDVSIRGRQEQLSTAQQMAAKRRLQALRTTSSEDIESGQIERMKTSLRREAEVLGHRGDNRAVAQEAGHLIAKMRGHFQGSLDRLDWEDSDSDLDEEAISRLKRAQELEALRQTSRLKSMFNPSREERESRMLKRSSSCMDMFDGGKPANELDDDTMKEVRQSNAMVRAMFEASAPKYRFGGSGSNLSLNSGSKENLAKPDTSQRPKGPKKSTENRRWVLDTINKYFEVIVEENDDMEEEEEVNLDSSEAEESDYDDEEVDCLEDSGDDEAAGGEEQQAKYQSTAKMRSLFTSVVSNLSRSMTNLAGQPTAASASVVDPHKRNSILSNLKQKLGSQISLRKSSTCDLTYDDE